MSFVSRLEGPTVLGKLGIQNSVRLSLSVFGLIITFAQGSLAQIACSSVFQGYAVPTLTQLQERAAIKSNKVPQATFANPKREIELAKFWGGIPGPQVLKEILPQGMSYISHSLPQANELGVVKTNSGHMAHLRAEVRGVETNMGVNVGALYDNFFRTNKSVVREEAKAVVLFIHGGGTKTTGHHVAISLLNYLHPYKVDVISMDMPWHGEGPRVSFENAKESLELMREYVKKYVSPSGKPVILAGHSMGGVVSDLYMRLFPKDDLFSAVIPLSTVGDALPGGSAEAKQALEQQIALANLKNTNIPAGERDLSATLARQNKISPVCGMYCSMLMYGLDWKAPAHQGQDYLPALYIIGQGDALYQGYEKPFQFDLQGLKNVTLKVYNERRDIKDRDGTLPPTPVGHMIFDHRPHVEFKPEVPVEVRKKVIAGTIKENEFNQLVEKGLIKLDPQFTFKDLAEPETFVLMRNFIGQVIKQDLSQKTKFQQSALANVIQAWANNLAFREFASSYILQYNRATEKTSLLGPELAQINKRLGEIVSKQKQGKASELEVAEMAPLRERQKQILGLLSGDGSVPPEKAAEFARLQQEMKEISETQMAPLNNQKRELRSRLEDVKFELSRNEKTLQALEEFLVSPMLTQIKKERDETFSKIMEQDEVVRILTERYLLNSYSQGKFKKDLFEDLPADMIVAFEKYEQLSSAYQKIINSYNSVLISEANLGRLSIKAGSFQEAVEALPHYLAEPKNLAELQVLVLSTSRQMQKQSSEIQQISSELLKIEENAAQIATRIYEIQEQKAQLAGSDYFILEKHTVQSLLEQPLENARPKVEEMNNILQRLWAEWQKVWADRSSESSESLY